MALLVEILSLVRARNALSWRFLPRTELHALVLGGRRKEGAGLLFGGGLAAAANDVGGGIGGGGRTSSWKARPSRERIAGRRGMPHGGVGHLVEKIVSVNSPEASSP